MSARLTFSLTFTSMGKDLGFHNRSKSKKENPKSKHKNTFSKINYKTKH